MDLLAVAQRLVWDGGMPTFAAIAKVDVQKEQSELLVMLRLSHGTHTEIAGRRGT